MYRRKDDLLVDLERLQDKGNTIQLFVIVVAVLGLLALILVIVLLCVFCFKMRSKRRRRKIKTAQNPAAQPPVEKVNAVEGVESVAVVPTGVCGDLEKTQSNVSDSTAILMSDSEEGELSFSVFASEKITVHGDGECISYETSCDQTALLRNSSSGYSIPEERLPDQKQLTTQVLRESDPDLSIEAPPAKRPKLTPIPERAGTEQSVNRRSYGRSLVVRKFEHRPEEKRVVCENKPKMAGNLNIDPHA